MANIVKEAEALQACNACNEEMSEFEKMLAKAQEMEVPVCDVDNPDECIACGS